MSLNDPRWGQQVLSDNQHFFEWLSKYIESLRSRVTVTSGQTWNAFPSGSYVLLVSKKDTRDHKSAATRESYAVVESGVWKPLPTRLPGPCAGEVHFVPGSPPDARHWRPGLLLGRSHTGSPGSTPLLKLKRALWIRSDSKAPNQHGRLRVRGLNETRPNTPGAVVFWAAWSIEIPNDLLDRVGDISRCSRVDNVHGSLHDVATGLMAELLGVKSWPDENGRPAYVNGTGLRRGEIVLTRFGANSEWIPSLVISPDAFNNMYDDIVVLQCVPFNSSDETNPIVVPLSTQFIFNKSRWTIDPTLVRGIPFARRYARQYLINPKHEHYILDRQRFDRVHDLLTQLYA